MVAASSPMSSTAAVAAGAAAAAAGGADGPAGAAEDTGCARDGPNIILRRNCYCGLSTLQVRTQKGIDSLGYEKWFEWHFL